MLARCRLFDLALYEREHGLDVDLRECRWALGEPRSRPLQLPRGAAGVSSRQFDARGSGMDEPADSALLLPIDRARCPQEAAVGDEVLALGEVVRAAKQCSTRALARELGTLRARTRNRWAEARSHRARRRAR